MSTSMDVDNNTPTILSTLAAQVTFWFPHLRILEVRSNMDGEDVTRSILHAIRNSFSSYTVSLPTNALEERAYSEHGIIGENKRVMVACLDVGATELPAGAQMKNYGTLIATGLQQGPRSLDTIFRNIHHLLQPGGYLLMTQPLASSQDTTPPSGISSHQCDTLLREADFSGIDYKMSTDHMS